MFSPNFARYLSLFRREMLSFWSVAVAVSTEDTEGSVLLAHELGISLPAHCYIKICHWKIKVKRDFKCVEELTFAFHSYKPEIHVTGTSLFRLNVVQ